MDDRNVSNKFNKMSNQFLPDTQTGSVPSRIAPPIHDNIAPPIPARAVPSVPGRTMVGRIPQPMNPSLVNTTAPTNMLPRSYRRVSMPVQQQYLPSTVNSPYAAGTYPLHVPSRPYVNMNMGGFNSGYNPYSSFGQPMTSQFQNPAIIAVAENYRPAFESIQHVIQTFNSISMMLESTFTAMHVSFQALLGVAENVTRLRMFMMKLYSVIVSFKLARWFLTKLFHLLKMVRGSRGSSAEEDLWTALSTTQESIPSDGRAWPLVIFTGLLAATPILVYKLLNSVTSSTTPVSNTQPMYDNENSVSPETLGLVVKACNDWNSLDVRTIPLVKGQVYYTSKARLVMANQNGGWLLVNNQNGQKGYVPVNMLKLRSTINPPPQSIIPEISNITPTLNQHEIIPEQIQPQFSTTPIQNVLNNSVALPQELVNHDDFKKNDIDE